METETPSSVRRVTRSQTALSSQKVKQEDGVVSRSRTVLLDITNDSPIIGLAQKTPLSMVSKSITLAKKTPGSGEALLRGQVKTLLQQVEEEAVLVNKLSAPLIVPMPANTSHVPSLSCVQVDKILIAPPVVSGGGDPEINLQVEHIKSSDCLINRALLFDSPEKTETVHHVSESILEEEGDDYDEECLDELIEGLMKMSMQEDKRLPEFAGKHTRFIYNSDDELEAEEEVRNNGHELKLVLPSVLLLKGLPVPEGKHLRFQDEDEEED
ncbi:hypothetical protein J5N97_008281 [Dioscorea zingiberensis]|uniref:Chalcone-flavanone isomerase family protein n=1 Tax=Dioscorea zingiberensis TaxID=325984 RepID=A0A9D5HUG3_9LILI|nr:hypothetical protein J5N97_008281 [Dioscorea zingiberensis]